MIFKDMEEVRRHLRIGMPLPCYFVSGSDDQRKRAVLKKLSDITVSGGGDYDCIRFSGSTPADTVADAAFAITFGGGRRCVIAEDIPFNSLGDTEYGKFEELVEEVGAMGSSTVLIFTFSAIDADAKKDGKRNRFESLRKKIDKVGGGVIHCDTPTASQLCAMMEHAAEQKHCVLSRELCQYMVERCGMDSAQLLNEVKKLCEFHGEGTVTKMEVDLLTCPTPDARIYDINEKIASGDRDGAFAALQELRELGERAPVILTVLSGSYVDLFRGKLARNAGKTAGDLQRDWPKSYSGKRGFLAEKILRTQGRYTKAQLLTCLDILLGAEQKMKGTGIDADLILDETVARLFAVR